MKITYYGHSCFTLESDGFVIALDPYNDMVPGYGDLKLSANKVYCSHGHLDHAYTDAVEIVPADRPSPFIVEELELPHDDAGGSKRGFTSVRMFTAEGKTVVHYGDLGCALPDGDADFFRGADVALIPVGGVFTIDGQGALDLMERTEPVLTIPMHYRKGDQGLRPVAELSEFLKLCEGRNVNVKTLEYGESYTI